MATTQRTAHLLEVRCLSVLLVLTIWLGSVGTHAQDGSARRARAARLTQEGDQLAAAGDRVSAAGAYRDAIHADPTHGPAYAALGRLELLGGRISDAIDAFSLGLEHSPGTLDLWIGDAEARAALGDVRAARARLSRMVIRFADDPRAHRERARFAERLFAWAEALASYRALLSLDAEGRAVDAAWLDEARAHIAALEVLLGDADPLARAEGSEIRAALSAR